MKRTATTLALLAGFGGGCATTDSGTGTGQPPAQPKYGTVTRVKEIPNVQGPGGEPVGMTPVNARGAMPGQPQTPPSGPSAQRPGSLLGGMGVQPAGAVNTGGVVTQAYLPGGYDRTRVVPASGFGPGNGPPPPPNAGILPVPGQGPPGAVAAVGAIMPGMAPPVINQRTSIRFTGPAGMKITWQMPNGGFNDEASGLTAPKEYNFMQGQVYRLRLTQILPNFPGRTFYPTLEVVPTNPKTVTFLAHSSVPVTFTNDDFDQVVAGNLVVKVIYLPDPAYQDFVTVAGAEEIVSTRLEPGADPIAEAQRRGSILAIIRLGNIDLENRSSPAMNAPPGGMMMPPGFVPPGMAPPGYGPQGVPPRPVGPMIPPGAPVPPPGGPGAASIPPIPPVAAPGPLPPTVGSARPVNNLPPNR
jgi:hypothetical protein